MSPGARDATPLLAAVVVARNEETFIGPCLEALCAAGASYPGFGAVLVDSRSSDRTVDVARQYDVAIARVRDGVRCTAALARRAGESLTKSRYVLFVDGDTVIDATWLQRAIRLLESSLDVAGVGGRLREVYYRDGTVVGGTEDFFRMGPEAEDAYQLGGNALYRRSALNRVGSFHPGVVSHEEAELAARLWRAGHRLVRIPHAIGTHHTDERDSLAECWRRFRAGLMVGYGQVLRLTLGTPLFWRHVRALNRYLACLAFLALGTAALVLLAVGRPVPAVGWAVTAGALCAAFAIRARGVRRPITVLADWVLAAPGIVWGFLRGPDRYADAPGALVDIVHTPAKPRVSEEGALRC